MRITIQDIQTTEKLDANILDIVFDIRVEPVNGTQWQVRVNDQYRIPETFDDKADAVREMNGVYRDLLNARERAQREAAMAAENPETPNE